MADARRERTNKEVRTNVLEALAEDARTAETAIEVIAEQGVVTLRGSTLDRETREAAEEITRGQEGVIEVINDLDVESPENEIAPGVHPMASKESRPPIIPG
jgi:osmotically-inducible protein OsmY